MTEDATAQPGVGLTIAKNTLMVTAGTLALKAVNFLFNVFVIRKLGDDRFGQYSVVLAFAGIYQIFAELGVSQYAMRETARDHRRADDLFWNLISVRVILALIAMILMPGIAVLMGYSQQLVLGIFLFACTFLLSAILAPIQGLLTAFERFDAVTSQQVLGQIVFVIFGAIFLFSGLSYIWLIVASLISIIPQIMMGMYLVRRNRMLTQKPKVTPAFWAKLVLAGLPFGMITLSLSVVYKIDTILLKHFTSDSEVGWYNAAYNLVFSLMFLAYGFKEAIVPSLTRTYASDPTQVEHWYYRTVKFMLVLSMPIAVGGMLVSGKLVDLLYGVEYAPAALALAILIWDVPLNMFTSFCGNITTIISQERQAARIYALLAVVKVAANWLVIPRFGLLGAAIVTVAVDLVGAHLFHFLLSKQLHFPNVTRLLLKIILAAGIMGVVIWLAGSLHVLALIGIGFGVYLLLVFVLRLIDEKEWSMINRLLHFRRGASS